MLMIFGEKNEIELLSLGVDDGFIRLFVQIFKIKRTQTKLQIYNISMREKRLDFYLQSV